MVESLPGITSFHNLMYITHNRVYQGCESERRGEGVGVVRVATRRIAYYRMYRTGFGKECPRRCSLVISINPRRLI